MDILGWEIRATLNLSSLAQWNETSSFLCALSIHMCLCLCIFVPVLVACERYFEWWDETLSWELPAQCQKPPVTFPPLPHTPADGINLGWKWVIIGVLEHHFSFAFCARSLFFLALSQWNNPWWHRSIAGRLQTILTLLGPAYLSVSKDRGGAHCAPLNISGLVGVRVPNLFG